MLPSLEALFSCDGNHESDILETRHSKNNQTNRGEVLGVFIRAG